MNIIRKIFGKDDSEHMQNDENNKNNDKAINIKKDDQEQIGDISTGPPARVDTSPIDRSKASDCLKHHLADSKHKQRRKSDSDLSAVLQGPAHELQMAQTKDQLAQLMRKREDRHSLVEQGILLDEKCIAGSIQSNAKELERHLICDKLEHELKHRPAKEELEKTGVIKEGMGGVRSSLEQEQLKIYLKRKLSDRPSPEELQKQHILEPMDDMHNGNEEIKIKTHIKKKQKN